MRHRHTFDFRGMTLRDALKLLNEEELYNLYYILGSAGKRQEYDARGFLVNKYDISSYEEYAQLLSEWSEPKDFILNYFMLAVAEDNLENPVGADLEPDRAEDLMHWAARWVKEMYPEWTE